MRRRRGEGRGRGEGEGERGRGERGGGEGRKTTKRRLDPGATEFTCGAARKQGLCFGPCLGQEETLQADKIIRGRAHQRDTMQKKHR